METCCCLIDRALVKTKMENKHVNSFSLEESSGKAFLGNENSVQSNRCERHFRKSFGKCCYHYQYLSSTSKFHSFPCGEISGSLYSSTKDYLFNALFNSQVGDLGSIPGRVTQTGRKIILATCSTSRSALMDRCKRKLHVRCCH